MKRRVIAGAVVMFCAGLVGKAIADGIPTVTPLTYSGVLQGTNGAPITAQQSIQLTLWDDATANMASNTKCTTPTQNVTPDSQGRFQVQLDQTCFEAVKANPNLWVQLQIGATVLPRTKINAVPYAVEAGRSTRQIISNGDKRRTVFGQYCGATAAVNGAVSASGGAVTGYPATKILCEQACSSQTAHICLGAEVAASYEIGVDPPAGRVAAFAPSFGLNVYTEDCVGFTSAAGTVAGAEWNSSKYLGFSYCSTVLPLLCCD